MMSNYDNPAAAQTDVLEERIIDAEYKIWKKNTPYLYDFVMTHSLEWPSLTCQWLPTTRNAGGQAVEHTMLLGTHTTGEQNYLMVASCPLLKEDAVIDNRTTNTNTNTNHNTSHNKGNVPHKPPPFDEDKNEMGGFGHASSQVGKIEIKMKVRHEGEVNRARYMPGNHFIVAARGPNPEVYIFDLSKHPSFPDKQSTFRPNGVCVGHSKEGYALEWSPQRPAILLTGSDDTTVKLWDVSAVTGGTGTASAGTTGGGAAAAAKPPEAGTQIMPLANFTGHTATVEDVDWHAKDENLFGSVGDDKVIRIWDSRKPEQALHSVEKNTHAGDINSIAFNPVKEYLFATGSADKTIKLWDMRNLGSCLETLQGHSDQVYKVEWSPFNESILASCSDDRRVGVWDLSRIGAEQTPEDAEDGPPELLFLHGGHTSKVSDFSWNNNDHWTIASVSEDNVLQVWNMAEEIYAQDDDEENKNNGEGEDGMLQDNELE